LIFISILCVKKLISFFWGDILYDYPNTQCCELSVFRSISYWLSDQDWINELYSHKRFFFKSAGAFTLFLKLFKLTWAICLLSKMGNTTKRLDQINRKPLPKINCMIIVFWVYLQFLRLGMRIQPEECSPTFQSFKDCARNIGVWSVRCLIPSIYTAFGCSNWDNSTTYLNRLVFCNCIMLLIDAEDSLVAYSFARNRGTEICCALEFLLL